MGGRADHGWRCNGPPLTACKAPEEAARPGVNDVEIFPSTGDHAPRPTSQSSPSSSSLGKSKRHGLARVGEKESKAQGDGPEDGTADTHS